MGVKSVEVTSIGRGSEAGLYEVNEHTRIGTGLLVDLGMKVGWRGTLIAVEHPEPEPEEERKECAKVDVDCPVCANCGKWVSADAEKCPICHSHFTHTIKWEEFARGCRE